jgi:hypothetical protein
MSDAEVGNANIPHLTSSRELLHFLPRLDVIPIWMVLLQVARIGGRWPVDQVQINIVSSQGLQGGVNPFLDSLVPRVVQLGG